MANLLVTMWLSAATPTPADMELVRCEETRTKITCYWRKVEPKVKCEGNNCAK